MPCSCGCRGRRREEYDAGRQGEGTEDPARQYRRCAADRGAKRAAWISGEPRADPWQVARHQAIVATRCIRSRIVEGWSHRLAAREQEPAAGSRSARRGEWPGRGGRAEEPGRGRAIARGCGGLGAQTRLQKYVVAFERDPRACSQVLRTKRLRALQNAKVIPQAAVIPQSQRNSSLITP